LRSTINLERVQLAKRRSSSSSLVVTILRLRCSGKILLKFVLSEDNDRLECRDRFDLVSNSLQEFCLLCMGNDCDNRLVIFIDESSSASELIAVTFLIFPDSREDLWHLDTLNTTQEHSFLCVR